MNDLINVTNANAIMNEEVTQAFVTSVKADTDEEKKKLFHIMQDADKSLSEHINEIIVIKDIFIEKVDCTNTNTGEIEVCPRVVLIDVQGVSYGCVSFGILNSIQKISVLFGEPTWENGISVKIKQKSTKKGNKMLVLELV